MHVNVIRAARNTDNFIKKLNQFLESDARDHVDIYELIDSIENILMNFQPMMSSYIVLEHLQEQKK